MVLISSDINFRCAVCFSNDHSFNRTRRQSANVSNGAAIGRFVQTQKNEKCRWLCVQLIILWCGRLSAESTIGCNCASNKRARTVRRLHVTTRFSVFLANHNGNAFHFDGFVRRSLLFARASLSRVNALCVKETESTRRNQAKAVCSPQCVRL